MSDVYGDPRACNTYTHVCAINHVRNSHRRTHTCRECAKISQGINGFQCRRDGAHDIRIARVDLQYQGLERARVADVTNTWTHHIHTYSIWQISAQPISELSFSHASSETESAPRPIRGFWVCAFATVLRWQHMCALLPARDRFKCSDKTGHADNKS